MNLIVPSLSIEQPPVYAGQQPELTVAIASLSIGGAERIVLDWAARIYPYFRVHLIVLFDRPSEWPVPEFVRVTRLHDIRIIEQLEVLGRTIAGTSNPVCVCHLLRKVWRDALRNQGVEIVTVLHNAKDGWDEDVSSLDGSANVIAVSQSCSDDLREQGWMGPVSVIRHIPPLWNFAPGAREKYRREWNIPEHALVIGMIGAVKPQKNYVRALHVLRAFLEKRDAYLVIIGGPVNMHSGRATWEGVVEAIHQLGIRSRVAMPGFISGATKCIPAFDVMLNTSHFEGLSIATLEVLVNGMPIVASKVGGQGEVNCDGLTLVSADASDATWVSALEHAIDLQFATPSWTDFPSFRLWSLAGLAHTFTPSSRVLFLTENLNSGGAQRSLVNLATGLQRETSVHVSVSRTSTADYFFRTLRNAGVSVTRPNDTSDIFAYAEVLTEQICTEHIGTVCFWNLDPKLKLLLVKTLGHTDVNFVDVSPGGYAFVEMDDVKQFAELIAFTADDYYGRLNRLVQKFSGSTPHTCRSKTTVIQNGVPKAKHPKTDYAIRGVPRIVVSGRIAPTKFILEIVEAMRLVREVLPDAELHFYGAAEETHREYAARVALATSDVLGTRVFFHGMHFNVPTELQHFDAYVVLGENQGCPNALLEALSVGVPSVANDDGGTREQVIDMVTGLLVPNCEPQVLASALIRILFDRVLAEKLGTHGRMHVARTFSMEHMVHSYKALFRGQSVAVSQHEEHRSVEVYRNEEPRLLQAA